MTWIFIEPNDLLMFRDAKPFVAQQSFVATSMFPPTPQTMQGILRTQAIELAGVSFADYAVHKVPDALKAQVGVPALLDDTNVRVVTPASLGKFKTSGPFVGRRRGDGTVERLVPAPLDLVKNEDGQLGILRPDQREHFATDAPSGWKPLTTKTGGKPVEGQWLDDVNFKAYLSGQVPSSLIRTEKIYEIEERVGIGLDYRRRTTQQSQFYHARFVRVCAGVGLLSEVNDDLFGTHMSGVIGLGGEGRFAYYAPVAYKAPALDNRTTRIKIILLTPAYFKEGWQPTSGDWSPWLGPNARLTSAILGKPQSIGGFDVALRRQKPLRNYVPAGSIYYFQNATDPARPFTETPDGELDHTALGFGTYALGQWNFAS